MFVFLIFKTLGQSLAFSLLVLFEVKVVLKMVYRESDSWVRGAFVYKFVVNVDMGRWYPVETLVCI